MFYEKNASTSSNPPPPPATTATNNNNSPNQASTSTNSSRRSSFHQSPSIPSTSKPSNGALNRQASQVSSRFNLPSPATIHPPTLAERMQRSKSYKDLFDPPSASGSLTHSMYAQQQQQQQPSQLGSHPSTAYYSSSYHSNQPIPTIVGSMLGSSSASNGAGLLEYPRHRSSSNNFPLDDVSSSSTGHQPKPPPGIPSQNAR